MLNTDTKKILNELIYNIRYHERMVLKIDNNPKLTNREFEVQRNKALDELDAEIARFKRKVDMVYFKNLCEKVTESLKYYCTKAKVKWWN